MQFSEMLKPENVRIVQSVDTWQNAIRLACAPLEEGGYVEPCYADNIIAATEKMGPYYVLTEDVALVHGRPEDGVIKQQFAVTLLREPIKFSEDSFEVRLLVTLAAQDANSHIDAMRVLAGIFCDQDKINEIVALDTPQQVYDAFVAAASEQ